MKIKVVILLIVGFTAAVFYFILSNSYPVALVDGQIIKARDFEKDYAAAIQYYRNAFKIYAGDSAKIDSREVKLEIKRATLDKLIENKLIHKKLKELIGANNLQDMVYKKIEEAIKESLDIQKGVELAYGISLADFKKRILVPQSEREILDGQLFFNGEKIDEWLKEVKSQVRVIILISGFNWNGKEVIIK